MGVVQKLINLDRYFHSIPMEKKFILNDHSIYGYESTRKLQKALVNEYDNDTVDLVPRCSCGFLRGEYYRWYPKDSDPNNPANLKGTICPKCKTPVASINYDPVVWAKAISPQLPFINPVFYHMLNDLLDKDIAYLTGITMEPRTKSNISKTISKNLLNEVRTYQNFIVNIPNILDFLTTITAYRTGTKATRLADITYLWQTEDTILTEHVPLVSSVMFNMTNTNKGKFTDVGMSDVYDIAYSWMKVCNNKNATDQDYDNYTARLVSTLGAMTEYYVKNYISQKSGILRNHVFGFKAPFTFRTVICSVPGPQYYDCIEAPWIAGPTVYRPHILNKLMDPNGKYKMKYKAASQKVFRSCKKYDKDIDDILKLLIKESKYPKGLPVVAQRNPSLKQGSAELAFIWKFKTDVNDNTAGYPFMLCSPQNADYDGDSDGENRLKAYNC